jgi:hypothetical protein
MNEERETPFDSIEGAQEYLTLLAESLEDALCAVREDAAEAARTRGADRRVEALRLVDYKLNQLREHLAASRRILKDLRSLRRLLLAEHDEPPDSH